MSVAPARLALPRALPEQTRRPRLRIVRHTAAEKTRAPFIALCVFVLAGALLGALALNTSMAATSYSIRDKQMVLSETEQRVEALAGSLETVSSPVRIKEQALALGLVESEGVTYIRLSDSSLIGARE